VHKQAPLRLEYPEYEQLRRRVLRRDRWQCQFCRSKLSLEVHHLQFRSHSGEDREENLITLCANCHSVGHGTAHAILTAFEIKSCATRANRLKLLCDLQTKSGPTSNVSPTPKPSSKMARHKN
jgi:hypothetical protein